MAVPDFIKSKCSPEERSCYDETSIRGLDRVQIWSLAFFVTDYPEDGSVADVIFWVKLILEDPKRAKTKLPTWLDILDNRKSTQPAVGILL